MTVLIAYHSDKKNERAFHILGSSIVAMVGWILLSFLPSLDQYILAYFSCFLVVIGILILFTFSYFTFWVEFTHQFFLFIFISNQN